MDKMDAGGLSNRAAKDATDEEMMSCDISNENVDPVTEITLKDTPIRNLWSTKNSSLIALVFQQSSLVLMIRYSRIIGAEADHVPYIPSVVVVSAEVLKLLLNMALEIIIGDDGDCRAILETTVSMESLKLFIPALLYLVQNNLLFVALRNLSVPVYQVLNQGKLFTTAFFSRLLLGRIISYRQYFSLLVLAIGVVTVQQSTNIKSSSSAYEGNPWVGCLAVAVSCLTSGFATVYFEKVLKHNKGKKILSVYSRNMQLAFWSIVLGTIPIVMTDDWDKVKKEGFFQGYTWVVFTIIIFQTLTGLLVGLVMKHADAVLKGFATSVAVVLATVLSVIIFKDNLGQIFLVGAALVGFSVRMYTKNPVVNDK